MLVGFLPLLTSALVFVGAVVAAPTARNVPTVNGFPEPSPQQLLDIQNLADGTLSNLPPPPKIADSSKTTLQVITANELLEVAFFDWLIYNITHGVAGYELPSQEKKDELLEILETVRAQEQLHALTAGGALQAFKAFAPTACQYAFPATNIDEAFAFIETLTSVVLGTLQDASQLFAKNGDDFLVRSVASIIGQEGEQNGFYRILKALKPSSKPFLTTSFGAFAWTALQGVTVPGSCPYPLSNVNVPIFAPLSVVTTNIAACDQYLTFSVDLTNIAAAAKYVGGNGSGLYITYITGLNLPITEQIVNVQWNGAVATFEAFFPFSENVMDGLSLAALTTSCDLTTYDAVVSATLAAPGLIQVYDKVKA